MTVYIDDASSITMLKEYQRVEIPTVDLGSKREARCRLGDFASLEGVEASRAEGTRVILTVRAECAQYVHTTLYAAGLRPWNSASIFQEGSKGERRDIADLPTEKNKE